MFMVPFNAEDNSVSEPPPTPQLSERSRLTSYTSNHVKLKREIGLFNGIGLIVGMIIGSGIFVSPSAVVDKAGSVGLSLVVWLVCGVIFTLGALSYGELGTLVSESGSEYTYLLAAFGPLNERWGPLPAFIQAWMSVAYLEPIGAAVINLSVAEYAVASFIVCNNAWTKWAVKFLAICSLWSMTAINGYSVKIAAHLQGVFMVFKFSAIGIIVAAGVYSLVMGYPEYLTTGFQGTSTNPADIASSFYQVLWVYDGWNALNFVIEELKNPHRNLPLGIGIAMTLVTLSYVLVNAAYFAVLSPEEIENSQNAIAFAFGNKILGNANFLMPVFVAVSCYGASFSAQFCASRLNFVASRQGHMIEVMSHIQVNRVSPLPAILWSGGAGSIFILAGEITELIDSYGFSASISYGSCMVALILMRFTKKDAKRPFKVPILFPIIVLLVAVYLLVIPVVLSPQIQYLFPLGFMGIGALVYTIFIAYRFRCGRCTEHVTHFFQKLLLVVPGEKDLSF